MKHHEFRCFGARTSFAIEARLIEDPDATGTASGEAWSYGEFRIYVRSRCLTRHTAPEGMRDEIRWYLASLFRWLDRAWLPLFHEQRPPSLVGSHDHLIVRFEQGERMSLDDDSPGASSRRTEMQAWRKRHSLWSAAAGGILPNIWFRRQSDLCEISYDPGVTVGAPRSFEFQFGRGTVLIDVDIVARAFWSFLTWGVEAAAAAGATVVLPGQSVGAADEAQRWFLGRRLSDALIRTDVKTSRFEWGVLYPSSPEVAMFGTLRPDTSIEDANRLLDSLHEARSDRIEDTTLTALTVEMSPPTRDTAWEQGYDLALRTHDALHVRDTPSEFVDVEKILLGLGVSIDDIRISDRSLRGVAIAGDGFRPTVLVNEVAKWNLSRPGRRFTLAHEFGHILVDRGQARRVTHSSTPWAPEAVERRANAFAAMFLMPYRSVDAAIAAVGAVVDDHGLKRVAKRLRCSKTAVLEHLKNIDRISSDVYYRIRAESV